LVELQTKWIAGVLSGHIALPSPEEMMEDVKAFYETLEASNKPKHYTHNLGGCQVCLLYGVLCIPFSIFHINLLACSSECISKVQWSSGFIV
jgi:hypothetical protein